MAQSQTTRVMNPWVKVMNEQARIMTALAPRLFLDPVSRQQVKAAGEQKESKFGDLLASVGRALEQSQDSNKLFAWRAAAAQHVAGLSRRQRQVMDLRDRLAVARVGR